MAVLNNSNAISSGGYDINNSLRFRASASAYLNRTPGTTGNQKTFTWSGWVKKGALGSQQFIHHAFYGDSGRYASIFFTSSDTLRVQSGIYTTGASTSTSYDYITTQVFRDPSAWYHIVLAVDTTQATSGNRVKVYVNGSQITAFGTSTAPTQNDNTFFNITTTPMFIGKYAEAPGSSFLDGYLAEVNWIDGQALTPSSFGETDTTTGSWKPKAYTGTYGTNGFYLKFSDIATTSGSNAGLGKDFSGNTNYWITNNISVTAGTTYDAMIDSPTLTSATVANYCVGNPLLSSSSVTFSNANLKVACGGGAGVYRTGGATFGVSSGKYYWEFLFDNTGGNALGGVGDITQSKSTWENDTTVNSNFWYINAFNGNKSNGGASISYGSSFTTSDICMVAIDMDNGKIWWGKNGTWFASGDPAAGTNAGYTNLSGFTLTAAFMGGSGAGFTNQYSMNFGQRPFTYTPPTGFVRLNTYNLPDSTIKKGNTVMDATTYTGNGGTLSVTNAAGFKPDLVWGKCRAAAVDNGLYDSVRGVSKRISSNLTGAEITDSGVTSFNSNGFTLGSSTSMNDPLAYVGWQWQAGQGTNTSNTSGSITSTVSVNATAGFSVVTFNAAASGAFTVGHGLGVAPQLIITRYRNIASEWYTYHASVGNTQFLKLNDTSASTTSSTVWNNTSPTSTVFTLGSSISGSTSWTMVAYCWAEIAGFSKFGSYTGNGSTDGSFIFTGFRPKFIMVKRTDAVEGWQMFDTSINTYNSANILLEANLSNAEANSSGNAIDILSNGFKQRNTRAATNASGGTYIYMAFAENPFKNANAR
jgi:hypothetical protein